MRTVAILIVLLMPALAWAQGAAGMAGAAGMGGSAGAAGMGGAAGGSEGGGAPTVTSGGIGGRGGSPRNEGCTCRYVSREATGAWWLLVALAGGACRRRTKLR